jgi:glycosyltransferase involved in cell wall biosynthesis
VSAEAKKPKVLWFSLTPALGDTALGEQVLGCGWVGSLERELRDRVDLTIAFYVDSPHEPFRQNGTSYYPMPHARTSVAGKIITRLTDGIETKDDIARLFEVIDTVQPDLIHIHGSEGPFGLLQEDCTIPTLISIQGVLSVYELKFFAGLSQAAAHRAAVLGDRLKRNSFRDQHRRFARAAERERQVLGLTRRVAGRTSWDRQVVSILAPEATYHHLDEILRPSFYRAQWQPPNGEVLQVLTTTGPNLYKGFETLIRTAQLLEERGVAFRWSVAGLSVSDPMVKLFLRALKTQIPVSVSLLGSLDETALADQLAASDLYVGVSHIENSPNSLCEAQLVGLPCIATNAGGTASLVTDDQDGVLVQDGDPYALAGAILDLSQDRGRAHRLAAAARVRASRRHDRAAITEAVLSLYATMVGPASRTDDEDALERPSP